MAGKSDSKDIKYDILAELGIITTGEVYDVRAKIISWNGGEPMLDIRKWNKDNTRMSKGCSIALEGVDALKEALDNIEDEYDTPNDSIEM